MALSSNVDGKYNNNKQGIQHVCQGEKTKEDMNMGTGAAEYLVAANHFLQQARENINSISEDERYAVKSLQNLCTFFEYLGKARCIDASIEVNNFTVPNSIADGLMSLSMVHLNSDGNPLAALACLEAAIATEDKAVYHYMAGRIYYRMNIKQSALEHFQKAVSLDPPDEDYRAAYDQIRQEL